MTYFIKKHALKNIIFEETRHTFGLTYLKNIEGFISVKGCTVRTLL